MTTESRYLFGLGGIVVIARKVFFTSAHSYHIQKLSDSENKKLFGPCFSPYGHGHDYTLEVFLKGSRDKSTGLVVNLIDVDTRLKEIVAPLNFRHLTHEVPFFRNVIPTTENLARYLFFQVESSIQDWPVTLSKVRIYENADLWVDYGPQLDQ